MNSLTDMIYLDYAATTPVRSEVMSAMSHYFGDSFGNPSSLYALAEESRNAIDEARGKVAAVLGARASGVIFTSGGTESNNTAIKGIAMAMAEQGRHVVTSAVEHHAILHPAEQLEKLGWRVSRIAVNPAGIVDVGQVVDAVTDDTTVVSIMLANNEIGTIQSIREIGDAVHHKAQTMGRNIIVHTDAAQAAGKISLDVQKLGVDAISLSGHKVYGPKGVGVLYLHRDVPLEPLISGGGQEKTRRSGTENVPAVVGMGEALTLAESEREWFVTHTSTLRNKLLTEINNAFTDAVINGDPQKGLPNILNVSFPGLKGEHILLGLDFAGVAASAGSACSSVWIEPSHVLSALGMTAENASASVRFSLGRQTTAAEIDEAVIALKSVIEQLKGMPTLSTTD